MISLPMYRDERHSTFLRLKAWYSKDVDMISFMEEVEGLVTNQPASCHVYFQLKLASGTRLPDEPKFFSLKIFPER